MSDDRVKCVNCRIWRNWQCGEWKRAGLLSPSVGPALANLPQRCPAHQPKVQA